MCTEVTDVTEKAFNQDAQEVRLNVYDFSDLGGVLAEAERMLLFWSNRSWGTASHTCALLRQLSPRRMWRAVRRGEGLVLDICDLSAHFGQGSTGFCFGGGDEAVLEGSCWRCANLGVLRGTLCAKTQDCSLSHPLVSLLHFLPHGLYARFTLFLITGGSLRF